MRNTQPLRRDNFCCWAALLCCLSVAHGAQAKTTSVPKGRATATKAKPLSKQEAANQLLLQALRKKDLKLVNTALSRGASPNARDKRSKLALVYALDRPALLELLIKRGANVNARMKENADDNLWFTGNTTALMAAVAFEKPEAVKVLLKYGAAVNTKTDNGWTALTFAADAGERGAEMARLLISKGANVNPAGADDETPLMRASTTLNVGVAELLLKHGAKVNAKDREDDTPLIAAVVNATRPGRESVGRRYIKLLLDYGADTTPIPTATFNAIPLAEEARRDDLVTLLRTRKMPIFKRLLPKPAQTLFSRARKIMSWPKRGRFGGNHEVSWLSDSELLVGRLEPHPDPKIEFDWRFYRRDVTTGRETPTTQRTSTGQISPDGQRSLNVDFDMSKESLIWRVVELKTRKVTTRTRETGVFQHGAGPSYWLRDSRSWVWVSPIYTGSHSYVYSIDEPGTVHAVAVPLPPRGEVPEEYRPLGVLPDNRVLVMGHDPYRSYSHMNFYAYPVNTANPTAQKFTVQLPARSQVSVRPSPQMDRLLWILEVEDEERDIDVIELWVSDPLGSNMQPLGYYERPKPKDIPEDLDTMIFDWGWLPGGKAVSFTLNNGFYVLPVE